jgi:hypothetical protein
MMYGYGMGGGSGLGFVTWLAIFIDLVLLGIFLWKKIEKESKAQ